MEEAGTLGTVFSTLAAPQFSAWHSLTLLVIGVLNAGIGGLILRTRSSRTAMSVFVAMSGTGVWTISQGLLLLVSSSQAAFVLTTTMHVGSLTAVTGAFHFSLSYAGRTEWLRPRRLGLVYAISAAWGLLFVTNPVHELLYVPVSHAGQLLPVRRYLEPLYLVHLGYTYSLTVGALALMATEYYTAERGSVYAKQAGLIVFALFVPFFPNLLAYGGLTEFNYSHWAFGITGLLIATSLYRYQWLDLVPVGRDQVIEQVRDGYLVVDDQWRIVDSNPAARNFLGAEDLVGTSVETTFPESVPLLRGEETERQLSLDSAVVTVSASPITTERGEGFLLMLRDITEQRRTEKRFRALIENISDVITVVDEDGTVTYESPSVADVVGYRPDELVGTHIIDRVHPDDRADAQEAFLDLIERPGEKQRFEYRVRHRDGSRRTFEGVATNPEDDVVDGIIIASRDVTERIERERELEQTNEKLEQFAGLVSHDLRNPLNVIAGRSELARETGETDHLDHLDQAVERMEEMIDDLLVLSRSGQTVDDANPVALAAIARAGWENVRADDADFALDLSEEVTVEADRGRLLHVFENLYRNSLEHGRRDGAEPFRICVGTIEDSDTGREGFYIEDTGTGIPEDERDDIFDHGYSTNSDGTGFGLSIVREVVTAHGWEIALTDGPAGGARFEIYTDTSRERIDPE